MTMREVLARESVCADVALRDKEQVLAFVGKIGCEGLSVAPGDVVAALRLREELGSTGLGGGIAIPHARIVGLQKPVAVAIRLKKASDFDAVDEQPVDFVVALLLPNGVDAGNLINLAGVTRRLRDKGLMERIRSAGDSAAIYALLVGEDGM